jgi:hypothetical protein
MGKSHQPSNKFAAEYRKSVKNRFGARAIHGLNRQSSLIIQGIVDFGATNRATTQGRTLHRQGRQSGKFMEGRLD